MILFRIILNTLFQIALQLKIHAWQIPTHVWMVEAACTWRTAPTCASVKWNGQVVIAKLVSRTTRNHFGLFILGWCGSLRVVMGNWYGVLFFLLLLSQVFRMVAGYDNFLFFLLLPVLSLIAVLQFLGRVQLCPMVVLLVVDPVVPCSSCSVVVVLVGYSCRSSCSFHSCYNRDPSVQARFCSPCVVLPLYACPNVLIRVSRPSHCSPCLQRGLFTRQERYSTVDHIAYN